MREQQSPEVISFSEVQKILIQAFWNWIAIVIYESENIMTSLFMHLFAI